MKGVQTRLKELGTVLLFGGAVLLLLALIALVRMAAGGASFLGTWWRLCAFTGGIVLLAAAVLLLTHRADSKKMALWEKRFPHLPFTWAVLLLGVVLILAAGAVNYFAA